MPQPRNDAQKNGDCILPGTLDTLRLLGWSFHLDENDDLVITHPPKAISNERWVDVLMQCRKRVKQDVIFKANRERRQFVGGPLNGQRHQEDGYCKAGIAKSLGRADWVAYRLEKDGRAFYLGKATSKKKANQLIYASLPKNSIHRAPERSEPPDQRWKDSYGDDDDDD